MTKKIRQSVFEKYNGLCAYTGKQLGDDWQVDHVESKAVIGHLGRSEVDRNSNLLPACKIINHYKRALCLEDFRRYMMTFHKRLAKLPKKTSIPATQRRKDYMEKVAELFDITPEKPFSGKFYFETLDVEFKRESE